MWLGTLGAVLALLFGIAGSATAQTIAVQPDGRTIVGGNTELRFGFVARLDPNGALSNDFGIGGVHVDHRLGPVAAVAVQPDGKVLAAGSGGLARYLPDGSVDSGFGLDGLADVRSSPVGWAWFYSLLVLPDGRIAVGGTFSGKLQPASGLVFVFSADGHLEWSASTGNGVSLSSLLAREDGSLVMAGSEAIDGRGVLGRFLPGGPATYDPGFGGGAGLVKFSPPPPERRISVAANAIVGTADGLVVAGGAEGQLMLARFSGQGILDKGFAGDGFALHGGAGLAAATGLVVQPDGKFVVVGDTSFDPGAATCRVSCSTPFLARLSPAGALDGSFGQGGPARLLDQAGAPVPAHGRDVALRPEGKIVIAGPTANEGGDVVVGQFDQAGRPDPGFGSGGVKIVDPCAAPTSYLRRRGCLPSARVRLGVAYRQRGPALRLRVAPAEDWAQVRSVRIRLPRSLAVPRTAAGRVEFSYVDREEDRRSVPARIRPHGLEFSIPRAWGGSVASLELPAGLLQVVHPRAERRLRAFKVRVGLGVHYGEVGVQTLVVQRPG